MGNGSANEHGGQSLSVLGLVAAGLTGVTGAGFASGREAAVFFASWGSMGLWGVAVAGAALSVMCVLVLDLARRVQSRSYLDLLESVVSRNAARVVDGVLLALLGGALAVMTAGAGELVGSVTAVSRQMSAGAFTLGVGLVLSTGRNTFARLSVWMFPVILVACLLVAGEYMVIAILTGEPPPVPGMQTIGSVWSVATVRPSALVPRGAWWVAALLYGSYNSALLTSVYGTLGSRIGSPRAARGAGMMAGVALALILGLVVLALTRTGAETAHTSMPLLRLAESISPYYAVAYTWVLVAAFFTASIANGHALASRLTRLVGWRQSVLITTLGAYLAGLYGFKGLIGLLYPLFGWLWFPMVFPLLREHALSRRGVKMGGICALEAPARQGFGYRRLTDILMTPIGGRKGGQSR